MITADELVEMTEQEQQSPFKLGTVVELFDIGTAKIQFDGEEEPSEKEYSYLASYSPNIGDRVLLASVAGTYVIMDKIKYQEVAEESGKLFTLEGNVIKANYNMELKGWIDALNEVSGGRSFFPSMEVYTLSHTGNPGYNRLGFFGASPTYRRTVSYLNSSPSITDLSDVISAVNAILSALKAYGLIG